MGQRGRERQALKHLRHACTGGVGALLVTPVARGQRVPVVVVVQQQQKFMRLIEEHDDIVRTMQVVGQLIHFGNN